MMYRNMLGEAWSRPLTGVFLVGLLVGCGGGGDNSSPPNGAPRDISVTQPHLSAATPIATVGSPVQFDGGICGGGNGPLAVSWNFGDGSSNGRNGVHTYTSAGRYTLVVKCTDGSGNDFKWALTTEPVEVFP